MAHITLSELSVADSLLFQDVENFLDNLSDVDAIAAYGGDNFQPYNFGYSSGSYVSILNKLIEAIVDVYAIQYIYRIATSFKESLYY
ncbi:MAG: hypothetical protein KAF91_16500 [Nostoc sp. TH1S01]|nr:hypothetical protein [Nostoc sp. TH1S01]